MIQKILSAAFMIGIMSCQNPHKPALKSEVPMSENEVTAKEIAPPLDTIIQISRYQDWLEDKNQIGLRLDSVLSDSRCPPKVQCIWAGNAQIALAFKYLSASIFFKLDTHLNRKDTIIENYQISLLELSQKGNPPYKAKFRIRAVKK